MIVQIELVDTRTYRLVAGTNCYIVSHMNEGRHRWGLWNEGETSSDDLVLMEVDHEADALGKAVRYAIYQMARAEA